MATKQERRRSSVCHVGNIAIGGENPIRIQSMGTVDTQATGIENIHESSETVNAPYYNLQGVKVDSPTPGIYIHHGKKVLIR